MKNEEILRILMDANADIKDEISSMGARIAVIETKLVTESTKWKEVAKIAGPIVAAVLAAFGINVAL